MAMAPELVLIDTCMWVPFFNRPHSAEKRTIDGLIDEDRAALVGPILAEILCTANGQSLRAVRKFLTGRFEDRKIGRTKNFPVFKFSCPDSALDYRPQKSRKD
jgi:hypothetical protein